MNRRNFLAQLLGLAACGALPVSRIQAAATGSDGQPFNQEWLRATAQRLAQEPYLAPADARPPWLAAMDWDDYQALNNFRIDHSLWAGGELPLPGPVLSLGALFSSPCQPLRSC